MKIEMIKNNDIPQGKLFVHRDETLLVEMTQEEYQKCCAILYKKDCCVDKMNNICGDNRFVLINKAKERLLKSTNIVDSPDEMKVLDDMLFRCWQMGWLEDEK